MEVQNKLSSDPFDDKRYILENGINTLPFGSNLITYESWNVKNNIYKKRKIYVMNTFKIHIIMVYTEMLI